MCNLLSRNVSNFIALSVTVVHNEVQLWARLGT
jgi:hypothetical protein